MSSEPAPSRRHLVVAGATPYERGCVRGEQLREDLPTALDIYLRLFAALGVPAQDIRPYAERLADTVSRWDATLLDEVEGVAAGAGLDTWQVMALNGRTELLSLGPGLPLAECTTVVSAPPGRSPLAAQTWDWHRDLDGCWHTQQVSGGRQAFVGLAEHGMLAKVGLNAAGVGVLLNILSHRDDTPAGVPVHLMLAAVLGGATSVADALDLLRSAPLSSSSALTLVDPDGAVSVELSPHGLAVLPPERGILLHTNHFRDSRLALGDERYPETSGSWDRYDLVDRQAAGGAQSRESLVGWLRSEPGPLNVCCVPEPSARFGERAMTLATVVLEPAVRRASILSGSPLAVGLMPWTVLTAG